MALEERRTEFRFDAVDLRGHRGLGDLEYLGRLVDAAGIRDRNQNLQMVKAQAHSLTPAR
jgi:hypothetical protein